MDINPAVINAIGKPFNTSGISAISSFSLMPAIRINAKVNPMDEPKELNIVLTKSYPSCMFKIATPILHS